MAAMSKGPRLASNGVGEFNRLRPELSGQKLLRQSAETLIGVRTCMLLVRAVTVMKRKGWR